MKKKKILLVLVFLFIISTIFLFILVDSNFIQTRCSSSSAISGNTFNNIQGENIGRDLIHMETGSTNIECDTHLTKNVFLKLVLPLFISIVSISTVVNLLLKKT